MSTQQDEETALHLACKKGYTEVVKVLLAAKATVNTQNKVSPSALPDKPMNLSDINMFD